MLSRVADSLYWMSRYFERADHCARVLEANYNLMLNPSKVPTEERWQRIMASLGIAATASGIDPQSAMIKLTSDTQDESSIASCIADSRENAGQVREQISSEMWESLNRLYHQVTRAKLETDSDPMRLVAAVREGSYQFHGMTDATMNHGEGWQFIQLGKYMERSCALPVLLDAYFSRAGEADAADWVGLLASCAAFESYCRVYTADLKPDSMAEFLLLNPEFPYSVRYAVERMGAAIAAISQTSFTKATGRIERIAGRLRASLAYVQIADIKIGGLHRYLNGVIEQCNSLHEAVHVVYIDYPIQSALEA
ncbi:MAG TPA: alpha-E domain-containing protein [Bryobacteraceae bacterium]|nr:alpha-E domain-containing protein [Bryobacteraceae bacterium]